MDFNTEADAMANVVMNRTMEDAVAWLRQFAAKVLREEADKITEDDGDFRWHQVSDWLESRAKEIEQGKGDD